MTATVANLGGIQPEANPLAYARRVIGLEARSGTYLYDVRTGRLVPDVGVSAQNTDALTRGYLRWCTGVRHQPGDCLRLLREGPLLGGDGKYTLAMAIAMGSVWNETAEALKGLTEPEALMAMVATTLTLYLLLWTLPEPISKGVAATMTVLAIGSLGADTVWRILDGWLQLVREVDEATTFDQLRSSGDRYGAALGRNAARLFVMLATVAMARTAGATAQTPGGPALQPAAVGGLTGVQSVAMTAEGFTLAASTGILTVAAVATSEPGGKLIRTGDNAWTSSGGLKFVGLDKSGRNRIEHVLDHLEPDPSKLHHTVFNVPRNQLLRLLDEAWARRGPPLPNDPGSYVIPMGRVVGTLGESSIKLVVRPGTSEVITAYPIP